MNRPPGVLWLAASLLLVAASVVLTLVVGSALRVGAASDVVVVDPTSFTVSEPNGQATFVITLTIQPTDTVSIALSATSSECSVDPDSLVLTTLNWSTGVTATVTALDDFLVDGDQDLYHPHRPGYQRRH